MSKEETFEEWQENKASFYVSVGNPMHPLLEETWEYLRTKYKKEIEAVQNKVNLFDKMTTQQHGKIMRYITQIESLTSTINTIKADYEACASELQVYGRKVEMLTECEFINKCDMVLYICQGCKNKALLDYGLTA